MWRPKEGWAELLLVGVKKAPDPQLLEDDISEAFLLFADAGADVMHEADVKYLEEHKVLINHTEGKVKITFMFTTEEWLAFTGKEVV